MTLVTPKEASIWASKYLQREISQSNISYLIQYGWVRKHAAGSTSLLVSLEELKEYYDKNIKQREKKWSKTLGENIDWHLAFDDVSESERTKHVHRLHPYKGKFIPQLVEYILDSNTDENKKESFFKKGDVVLDPFVGSGTTLVVCGELGLNGVGVDISLFNCLISLTKVRKYHIPQVSRSLRNTFLKFKQFVDKNTKMDSYKQLKEKIHRFNKVHFTDFDFKGKVTRREINEKEYAARKLDEFFERNNVDLDELGLLSSSANEKEEKSGSFLETWYSPTILDELNYYLKLMEEEKDESTKDLMKIILCRSARSSRSTKHIDLVTLKQPQLLPYYCRKHRKICVPVESSYKFFKKNTADTVKRLKEYSKIREDVLLSVIGGDSTQIDLTNALKKLNPMLYDLVAKNKIDGIFTSPPYVGQIDYHEQHAYAYELLGIKRHDIAEIGAKSSGTSNKAKEDYVRRISSVLVNMSKYLKDDGDIFIVANDKFNLYPKIAKKSGLDIIHVYSRPVLARSEGDRHPYTEKIFRMRKSTKTYETLAVFSL